MSLLQQVADSSVQWDRSARNSQQVVYILTTLQHSPAKFTGNKTFSIFNQPIYLYSSSLVRKSKYINSII